MWYRTLLEKVEAFEKFLFPASFESRPGTCFSACSAEIFKKFALRRADINPPPALQIFDLVSIGARRLGAWEVGWSEPADALQARHERVPARFQRDGAAPLVCFRSARNTWVRVEFLRDGSNELPPCWPKACWGRLCTGNDRQAVDSCGGISWFYGVCTQNTVHTRENRSQHREYIETYGTRAAAAAACGMRRSNLSWR